MAERRYCPLTKSDTASLSAHVDTAAIVRKYKELGVAVDEYFRSLEAVEILECSETGYRFYYPFNVAGDAAFYQAVQALPWYYEQDKFEFNEALRYIVPGMTLLEVGCGRGHFLVTATAKGAACYGLEINPDSIRFAASNYGLAVAQQSLDEHATEHREEYDVVCAFQVLEHVTGVHDFVRRCLEVLRPRGLLICAVPNNDSVIVKFNSNDAFNYPPHHMGLWKRSSLESLPGLFGISLVNVHVEPLRDVERYSFYLGTHLRNRFGIVGGLLDRILSRSARAAPQVWRRWTPDHTIVAVFRKRG